MPSWLTPRRKWNPWISAPFLFVRGQIG